MNDEYILIVDDQEINRDVLRLMFEREYQILEAESGEECIRMAKEYGNQILLVLLDLHMPEMNGIDILRLRRQGDILKDIPVIVITVNDDAEHQVEALRLGATDYIIKPFIKEVTEYRVRNAIQISAMLRNIEQEKEAFQRKSERDPLTGLYNKTATEARITELLERHPGRRHLLCIFDLDDFKQINDTQGHSEGDRCIRRYANFISSFFRSSDIVGRFGGDEFIVFMNDVRDIGQAEKKMKQIFRVLNDQKKGSMRTSMSAGLACTSDEVKSYKALFNKADKALYEAKQKGKNTYEIIL